MKSIRILLGAVAVAVTASVVVAAEPSLDAARRCGALADRDARLNCYDQLFARAPAAAGSAAIAEPATATAATAAVAAAASVGAETMPKPREEKTAAAPTMLVARITAILPLQGNQANMFRITLDNGQVWETQEGHSSFIIKVGDTVRINKRPMGSYQVAREIDGKAGYPVRAIRRQ